MNPLESIVVCSKNALDVVCGLNVLFFLALERVVGLVGINLLSLAAVLHHEAVNSLLGVDEFAVESVDIVFYAACLVQDLVAERQLVHVSLWVGEEW